MGGLLRRVALCNLTVLGALASWTLTAHPVFSADRAIVERLHLEHGQRALIIHADDAGVTHSVDQAIEAMFKNGSISSSSIIVPAPWFPEIAAFARSHPEYDFGVHLALTSEWQFLRWGGVSLSDRIPSLLDPQGFLWSLDEVAAKRDAPAQVEAELRAQIERAKQFGVPITHLDTHMDTLMDSPELLQIYVDLGREYHLPILLWRDRSSSERPPWLTSVLDRSPWQVVFPVTQGGAFPGPAGNLQKFPDFYRRSIQEMKPDEITEIVIHPGIDNNELRAAMGDGSWGASWRATDFRTFSSKAMHAFLKQQRVRLVTWKEIGAAF